MDRSFGDSASRGDPGQCHTAAEENYRPGNMPSGMAETEKPHATGDIGQDIERNDRQQHPTRNGIGYSFVHVVTGPVESQGHASAAATAKKVPSRIACPVKLGKKQFILLVAVTPDKARGHLRIPLRCDDAKHGSDLLA